MNTPQTFTVEAEEADQRLDKFLSRQLPEISRARLQNMIEGGAVTRLDASSGGRVAEGGETHAFLLAAGVSAAKGARPPSIFTNSSYKVKPGETYSLTVPEVVALDLTPATGITLDVVYEDADILIINKPAGMTVHPAAGTREDTLVHALLAHCGDSLSGIGGVARPGIVHRIDKETSGLLAIAKNDHAHQFLSAQLKDHTMARTYIAYTWAALTPRTGMVEAPIARHPRHRRQMAVVKDGKEAISHYQTLFTYHAPGAITPMASKVLLELETGRTHQIRVHMEHKKCPLLGDPVYGASTTTRLNRLKSASYNVPAHVAEAISGLNRQALHAIEMRLIHPTTEQEMEFSCPLPDDLVALENALSTLTVANFIDREDDN